MVEDDVLISIIVLVYNVEAYLRKCIKSIISQSYRNLDIILVNDGSTDTCSMICDYYAGIDNRVKVIHKENGGVVSARKAGTLIATGDYIISVDGDDWIEEDRIEVLIMDGIRQNWPDMVYLAGCKKDFEGSSVLVESEIPIGTFLGSEIRNVIFPLTYEIEKAFCVRVGQTLWSWAIRRELIQEKQKNISNEIMMGEDVMCILFCLLEAQIVTLIRQNGYHYVQRKSSIMYMAADRSGSGVLSLKKWYCQVKEYLRLNPVVKDIERVFWISIICLIINLDYQFILCNTENYLYPFSMVKKGSKIIIYGAGRMGYALMKYLVGVKSFQVVLWVDKDEKRIGLPEMKVSPIIDIDNLEYDYIIVAIQNADVAEEVRGTLRQRGIVDEKIALMDPSVITEEAIPEEIRGL